LLGTGETAGALAGVGDACKSVDDGSCVADVVGGALGVLVADGVSIRACACVAVAMRVLDRVAVTVRVSAGEGV
jgi:hypothetical protein